MVLGIVLWNVLIILGVRVIFIVFVCGNVVILKVFELCLRIYSLIIEVLEMVGFFDGMVNIVINFFVDVGEVVGVLID